MHVKMKKIRSLLLTFALAALISCGEAGFGFDVAAEVPVDPGEIVIDVPPATFNLDPDQFTFSYNLNDVDGFQDAIDELNRQDARVFLIGISYEISGVNDANDTFDEAVPVEVNRVDFNLSSGTVSADLPLSGGTLQNVSKTPLDITTIKSVVEDELLNRQGFTMDFVFDAGVVTPPPVADIIDFDILVYFDVALRVRNINN